MSNTLIRSFNLPDFQDRIPQGAGSRGSVGTNLNESLPNITGTTLEAKDSGSFTYSSGAFAFEKAAGGSTNGFGGSEIYGKGSFSASRSSSTYQDNSPVQQDAVCVNFCIKY